jgi:hypothetical protein
MLPLTILDSHKQFTRNSIFDEIGKETALAEKEIKKWLSYITKPFFTH